jgi:type I restriction enzyme S subunit
MAQNLYNEWFVKFRFPGHQHTRFTDSPLGPIPDGWEMKVLGDCCELVMGQSPKSEFYNESGEGLPFHQGVTNFGNRFPTDRVYCTITERIAEEGDILFSVRAPVGRINIALHRLVIGRGVAAIRARDRHQFFLLHQLKEVFYEEDSIGNGAIFKAVTKSDLMGVKLIKPASPIIAEFNGMVHSIGLQIKALTAKNTTLRRTRDLLLPRLISGEVDVSALDITIPEEAA